MQASQSAHSVAAVIVAYRPELALLHQLIAAIRPQVDALWLVNNGNASDLAELDADTLLIHRECTLTCRSGLAREKPHAETFAGKPAPTANSSLMPTEFTDVNIVQFEDNLGIGAAIAYATQRAQNEDYAFLLTLDQDSIPAPDMVQQLLSAYEDLNAQGAKVAGVGPEQIDRRSGHYAPFMQPINAWPLPRHSIYPPADGVIEVDHLITSGLLAPLSSYQAVGAPRADLFIDYVDIEWSLRARRVGYRLFAVGGAQMQHSIGDNYRQFMGKQVPIHSPLRHYYLMRNGVFLQKLPTISLGWKMSDALQLVKKFIFFGFFLPQHATRWRMMLRGIHDGLRGKLGMYQERP